VEEIIRLDQNHRWIADEVERHNTVGAPSFVVRILLVIR
jgi:hypothetical protein